MVCLNSNLSLKPISKAEPHQIKAFQGLQDAFYNYIKRRPKRMIDLTEMRVKKLGRPRAIPEGMELALVELYQRGYGYRAITRILREEKGLNPHYSSVRKTLVRLGIVRSGK